MFVTAFLRLVQVLGQQDLFNRCSLQLQCTLLLLTLCDTRASDDAIMAILAGITGSWLHELGPTTDLQLEHFLLRCELVNNFLRFSLQACGRGSTSHKEGVVFDG